MSIKAELQERIDFFRQANKLVECQRIEERTNEDIANIGHVSISKCSKMFKKYVQMSPIDFLNNYRLEVSSKQLKETTKSISEIAQDCGFSQQSYFNRLFLRAYHCTPRQYRIDKSPRKVYV